VECQFSVEEVKGQGHMR